MGRHLLALRPSVLRLSVPRLGSWAFFNVQSSSFVAHSNVCLTDSLLGLLFFLLSWRRQTSGDHERTDLDSPLTSQKNHMSLLLVFLCLAFALQTITIKRTKPVMSREGPSTCRDRQSLLFRERFCGHRKLVSAVSDFDCRIC